MKAMDAMQQALAAVSAKAAHDLTEPVFLLCEWSAKYHLAQMKAAASAVRPIAQVQPMPEKNASPLWAAQTATLAGITSAFEALLAAQKAVLGNSDKTGVQP